MKASAWLLALALVGCARGERPGQGGPPPDADPPPGAETGAAAIDIRDQAYVGVVVPAASVDISSAVGGKLAALPIPVGAKVLEGEVIATLANPDLRHQLKVARAGVSSARSNVTRSQHESSRAKAKRAKAEQLGELVSGEEREDAKFEVKRSTAVADSVKGELGQRRATVGRLQAQVDALTVRAGFAGVVAVHYQSAGQILAPQARIIRLISDDTLLRFAVPHADAAAFEIGAALAFEPDGGGAKVAAKIRGIAPEVDAASMVLIEAALDAPQTVRAGVSGRVRLAKP